MNDVNQKQLKPMPPALPATVSEWDKLRDIKKNMTLNDRVEAYHRSLEENPTYGKFLYAVYDEQAVEGSLTDDDHGAARMIRDQAVEKNDLEVANQKIASIKKALKIVLRRYHQSRKERKNMIGGQIVPDNGGE